MSQEDPTQNIYRQENKALSTLNQCKEWRHDQMLQMAEMLKQLQKKIEELTKKNLELQPNLKKK